MTERSKILIYNSVPPCRNLNSTRAIVLSIFLYYKQTVIEIEKIQTNFFLYLFFGIHSLCLSVPGPCPYTSAPCIDHGCQRETEPKNRIPKKEIGRVPGHMLKTDMCYHALSVGGSLSFLLCWSVINS